MSYRALRFDIDAASSERWSDALLDAGALSVDLADPHADSAAESAIYGEPGVAHGSAWPVTRITALFERGADLDAAIAQVASAMARPCPPHERFDVAEQDWVRATQAQFAPMRIDERLWVVPSWSTPMDANAINLVLDPGLAFGTGSHATTRLCLLWLAQASLRGRSVLDYGCGSGILAIAAARLGAGTVVGTDVDPQAIAAATANAQRNGVAIQFVPPDALTKRAFDVLVANILANPLVLLAPALAARVHPGGEIVLSGVLDTQAGEVTAAYAPWFRIVVWQREEGWVALHGERHTD